MPASYHCEETLKINPRNSVITAILFTESRSWPPWGLGINYRICSLMVGEGAELFRVKEMDYLGVSCSNWFWNRVVTSPHIGDFLVLLLLFFSVGISNKAAMHQCILFISWVNVFWQHTMFSWTLICSMTSPLTWFAAYFTEMHSLLMWFAWYNPGNVPCIMNCFGPSMSAKYANIEWSLPAQPISFAEKKGVLVSFGRHPSTYPPTPSHQTVHVFL